MKNITVAVLCGGPSPEAEVSRLSAREITKALTPHFEHVVQIEFDEKGVSRLLHDAIDVVFPIFHGAPGEDGTVQGLLECLQIPYVGSGVKSSALAMDKVMTKKILATFGIPLIEDILVQSTDDSELVVEQAKARLGESFVIKPLDSGSALGVIFADKNDLAQGLKKIFSDGHDKIMIEKRIYGREITVGVLQTEDDIKALPVIEITTPEGTWYDYEHKYTPGLSDHIVPAKLEDTVYQKISEYSVSAHIQLECLDFSRSDFIVTKDNEIYFLELNSLPGMTATSLYPDAARAAGISFDSLVVGFVESAHKRCQNSKTPQIKKRA